MDNTQIDKTMMVRKMLALSVVLVIAAIALYIYQIQAQEPARTVSLAKSERQQGGGLSVIDAASAMQRRPNSHTEDIKTSQFESRSLKDYAGHYSAAQ